jgi:DNA-directed RNA polymerase specialized sigma24 family protein
MLSDYESHRRARYEHAAMCFFEGDTYARIGQRLGVSKQRGHQLTYRGLAMIRDQLQRSLRRARFTIHY